MGTRNEAIALALVGMLTLGVPTNAWADSFLDRLMTVLGISASPGQMKGDKEIRTGEIWVADLQRGVRTPLTVDSGYRWPVFERDGAAIVALKGDSLVRIPVTKSDVEVLQDAKTVEKIVGFDSRDTDRLLIVLKDDPCPLAFLSLRTQGLSALPFDPYSKDHRLMVSHVKGDHRVYGSMQVYVERETKRSLEGVEEWSEVYLQRGDGTPLNVSKCDGVNCGQPSLSPDGKMLTYVRATPRR